MSDDEQAAGAQGKAVSYPKRYWWVVLVFLPIALTLIKVVPDLMKKDGSSSSGGFVNKQDGNNNVAINGSNNVLSTDLSTKTYVINMAAIEKEYAATKSESLGEDLKKQIAAAIALLEAGKPGESAAAFEKINQQVSLPSLQTDLGVA
ncbi:MAG: hypothetical protein ACXV97_05350, partial [Chthoniobacterales bacterium]